MGKRRVARERALQVLFELEFNDSGPEAVLARHFRENPSTAEIEEFASRLVRGVDSRRDEIDELVQGMSKHWRIPRMGFVDRNVLRIAVFELLDDRFLAPPVVINEAIEIVKRFSGDESAVFVNGVLDAVRKTLEERKLPSEVSHEPTKKQPPQRDPRPRARRKKE
jgi:N utilization substance protein B